MTEAAEAAMMDMDVGTDGKDWSILVAYLISELLNSGWKARSGRKEKEVSVMASRCL